MYQLKPMLLILQNGRSSKYEHQCRIILQMEVQVIYLFHIYVDMFVITIGHYGFNRKPSKCVLTNRWLCREMHPLSVVTNL